MRGRLLSPPYWGSHTGPLMHSPSTLPDSPGDGARQITEGCERSRGPHGRCSLASRGPMVDFLLDSTPYPCGSLAKGLPIAIEVGVVARIERSQPRIICREAGGEGGQLSPGRKPAPCRFPYFAVRLDEEPLRLRPWKFNWDTGRQPNVASWKLDREGCHRFNQQGRSPPQEGQFVSFEVLQCYKPLWERG